MHNVTSALETSQPVEFLRACKGSFTEPKLQSLNNANK